MKSTLNIDLSGDHPLPTVLAILGFVASFIIGIPLWFVERGLSALSIIFGVIMIAVGIFLWVSERQSY